MTTAKSKTKAGANKQATEAMMAAGQETAEKFWKTGAENYQKMFTQNKQQTEELFGKYDDFAKSGRDTAEAFAAAGKIYAQGMESLMAQWMAFNKEFSEKSVSKAQQFAQIKSMQDAIDMQTAATKEMVDDVVAHGTKVGEMTTKVYQDAMQPLNDRMQASMEKWTKAA